MNRSAAAGVMQSSPVQQLMMATGNPNWWNINPPVKSPPILFQLISSSSSSPSSNISPNFWVPPTNNNNYYFNLFPKNDSFSSSSSSNWLPALNYDTHQESPHGHLPPVDSWSQLLMSGMMCGDNEKGADSGGLINHFSHQHHLDGANIDGEKMESINNNHNNWQDHHHHHPQVKQENSSNCEAGGSSSYHLYGSSSSISNQLNHHQDNNFQVTKPNCSWPSPPIHHHRQIMVNTSITTSSASAASSTTTTTTTSSPPQSSCVTTFGSTNLMDFSPTQNPPPPTQATALHTADRSFGYKINSSVNATGGAFKKAKVVQPSSSRLSTFKVRKFGDRITALHQLVSPFGKTDTASVLSEAIGYIRFLHSQIEALSLPYLCNGNGLVPTKRQQHPHTVQGDQRNCLFSDEDPGQVLTDNYLKRKSGHDQFQGDQARKDLRSRGLCLVPVSCTLPVGSENGADYWAPALGGFR